MLTGTLDQLDIVPEAPSLDDFPEVVFLSHSYQPQ